MPTQPLAAPRVLSVSDVEIQVSVYVYVHELR